MVDLVTNRQRLDVSGCCCSIRLDKPEGFPGIIIKDFEEFLVPHNTSLDTELPDCTLIVLLRRIIIV